MDYNISYDVNKLDELVQDANNFYTNVKTKKKALINTLKILLLIGKANKQILLKVI